MAASGEPWTYGSSNVCGRDTLGLYLPDDLRDPDSAERTMRPAHGPSEPATPAARPSRPRERREMVGASPMLARFLSLDACLARSLDGDR
jgi:hypothetical protein